MSLQGPMLVVCAAPGAELAEALRAEGAFPVLEATWADAPAALAAITPAGVVIADPVHDEAPLSALTAALAAMPDPYLPVVSQAFEDGLPLPEHCLLTAADATVDQIIERLRSALRVRTLHATVLRRVEVVTASGGGVPLMPDDDPLSEATVLMTGRGRSYPALAVAVGERVGLIGALSVETAARFLNGRDIDAVVIGEGFGPRVVDALLTVIADDMRFRELPVLVCGGARPVTETYRRQLPNLEQVAPTPEALLPRLLPMARLHAFEARLKRMLASLDAEGLIDPASGLLAREAFWHNLDRAIAEARAHSLGLSVARFSFDPALPERIILDAARIVGRLVRNVDFACREGAALYAVFTETDLRNAHVITRRIASVLKHTMLMPEDQGHGVDPAVTLATLKSSDTLDSLLLRLEGSREPVPARRPA